MSIRITAWAAALLLVHSMPAAAQELSLAVVLQRAAEYVAAFHRQFAGVVAEERYEQEVKAFARRGGQPTIPVRTELRSDLLLVRPTTGGGWTEFRDVFEVNGLPVRDRSDRLTHLFLEGSPSAHEQIGKILDESSRFNIGDIKRNINTPVFALQILETDNQRRFKFKRSSDHVPAAIRQGTSAPGVFRTAAEIWSIEFEELRGDTLIKTDRLRDLPSRGRFWIDPYTGRVLMTELIAKNRSVSATVDVSYQSEPLVGFLVPVEMRESYTDRRGGRIEGTAEYGRFRQFHVNVDEQFLLKK
jgi:hypothetical protein